MTDLLDLDAIEAKHKGNAWLTREEISSLIAEVRTLREQLEAEHNEWSVMARACGNWREWPAGSIDTTKFPDLTENHWRAAARAIVERDKLRERVQSLEQSLEF